MSREQDALHFRGHRVDDRIVNREIGHEHSFRALPLLDIILASRCTHEGLVCWMHREGALYVLLVVRERRHHLAHGEIPQAYDGVHITSNHPWVALPILHI